MRSAASCWKYLISFLHNNLTVSVYTISYSLIFCSVSLTIPFSCPLCSWEKAITKPGALFCFLVMKLFNYWKLTVTQHYMVENKVVH